MENMELIINGIYYYIYSADDLQSWYGITIDDEYGAAYYGPESGVYTDEVIEVPESIIVEGQTIPVVSFGGGYNIYDEEDAASVSEVILPSSILLMESGFHGFGNLQKVTCYAETAPKLSSEFGEPSGYDFEGTPETKELYIPSDSDYTTWENDTTWSRVNEIYDGFVEIVNDLKYKETGENTVALIGYDETFTATSLTIPSSITREGNTYTVTEIKKNAFKNYTRLIEVNIPNSVTSIHETAFSNITDFETQTISVNNISLNFIGIDTKIDKFLFKNTYGISFTYGNNIKSFTVYACECLGLTDATISTPTLDLTNLTYNTNKISIYTIKQNAFANNNSIITAILPEETNLIEGSIFDNCQNLDTVYFNCKSVKSLSSEPFFGNNNYIKTIIIGNSVTSIGGSAFRSCSNLTSITIPDSVTYIGGYAFDWCSSLTSVTLGNSVTSIGSYAFEYCESLTSINIPDSVTFIGNGAFSYCSSLTSSITIPDGVTTIGNQTFDWCSSLTSVTIGNGVTSIGDQAFEYCESLTSVTIPNSVTSIGSSAFYGCTGLTSITIPDSVTYIGGYAFDLCISLTSITIPNSVTYIGIYAFLKCSGLTSITIPNGVTSIGRGVFMNCSSLKSVTIPDSVTSIGNEAFRNCSRLIYVYLLNPTASTISYDSNIFIDTPPTKVLFVPIDATGYSTSWGSTTWAAVNPVMVPTDNVNYKFNDEHLLETFSSNNKTESLTIPHNVLYKGNGYNVEKLSRNSLANDNKMKTLTIENSINKIEASALSGCNNLETVNIPDTVSEIDNHAFWMCKNLKNIVLPSTLTKLKPEMFVDCISLETITIPDGITTIPFRMFEGCKNLTKVNLPDTITEIQWSAFKDCVSLTEINIPDDCEVDDTAFEGTNIQFN